MPITRESQWYWQLSHHSTASYTEGNFDYVEHSVVPGYMTLSAQLSFTEGDNTGPFSAAIGFVDLVLEEPDLADVHANPADPSTWVPIGFGTVRSYRLGLFVARGRMTGSLTMLHWD